MKALIWSKYQCSHCDQAKQLLNIKGIEFEERKIGDGWTKEQLLESVPTAKALPQIFLDGIYLGGLRELKTRLS